jgi:hypothetical protein
MTTRPEPEAEKHGEALERRWYEIQKEMPSLGEQRMGEREMTVEDVEVLYKKVSRDQRIALARLSEEIAEDARKEERERVDMILRNAHPRQGPLAWQDGLDSVLEEIREAVRSRPSPREPARKEPQ